MPCLQGVPRHACRGCPFARMASSVWLEFCRLTGRMCQPNRHNLYQVLNKPQPHPVLFNQRRLSGDALVDGYWLMNHRGGLRHGRRRGSLSASGAAPRHSLEAPSTDRLTADRLAGVLSLLVPASPGAPTMRLPLGVSQRTSVAGPPPDEDPRDSALDGSEYLGSGQVISTPPVLELVISTPAVMEPAMESAASESAVPEPAVLRTGRHRRPISQRRAALRGFGAMSVRLSLMGLLVVFVAGATLLGVQFAMP